MEISKLTQFVDEELNKLTTEQKVLLFKELFDYPLAFKEGIYYYGHHQWDETRMKDFLSISQHWMTIQEYDKVFIFLNEKKKLS